MATNKECKCLCAISRTVSNAAPMIDLAGIQSVLGDLKFPKGKKPRGANMISELIEENAVRIKDSISDLSKYCVMEGTDHPELYINGAKAINKVIKSRGKDSDAALAAGSDINTFVQNNVSNPDFIGSFNPEYKRLMKCK